MCSPPQGPAGNVFFLLSKVGNLSTSRSLEIFFLWPRPTWLLETKAVPARNKRMTIMLLRRRFISDLTQTNSVLSFLHTQTSVSVLNSNLGHYRLNPAVSMNEKRP